MLIPVDAEVDSEVKLPLSELKPVDSELIPLVAMPRPVDAEVDSEVTLLLVVLRPVEVEMDKEFNWPTLTASPFAVPAATLVSFWFARSNPLRTDPVLFTLIFPPTEIFVES
jgi:pilus assembly protein FimV